MDVEATMKQWDAASAVQRDAMIAERLGRKWWKENKGAYTLYYLLDYDPRGRHRDDKSVEATSEEAWEHQRAWYTGSFPRYTADIAYAFELEGRLGERRLTFQYIHYLVRAVRAKLVKLDVQDDHADLFAIAHASAEQRAQAAYLTLCELA